MDRRRLAPTTEVKATSGRALWIVTVDAIAGGQLGGRCPGWDVGRASGWGRSADAGPLIDPAFSGSIRHDASSDALRGIRLPMGPTTGPPRSRSTELRAGPQTPAQARWFLAQALASFDVDVDWQTAALLTSEVASNAARHGKEPIDVTVSIDNEDVRVSIFDRGAGFHPGDRGPVGEDEGGWGLRLVEDLSSDWGVDRRDDGTEVWFRL